MPSGKLSFKLEYWESQNLMFTNQLKIVIMELSWGSDVELMKYLLKNTKELEEASIISSPAVPTNLIIELKKYKTPHTKLVPYHKSSKNIFHLCKGFFLDFFLPLGLKSVWYLRGWPWPNVDFHPHPRIVGIEYCRRGKVCDFFSFSR